MPTRNPELPIGIRKMFLDGAGAHPEFVRDFLIGEAAAGEGDHSAFTGCEGGV